LEAKNIFDVNQLKMTLDKCEDENAPKDTGAVQKEGEEVQVAKKASEDQKEAEKAKIKWSLKFGSSVWHANCVTNLKRAFVFAVHCYEKQEDKNADGIQESTGYDSLNTEPVKLR
jgi:hypothetical protein